MKKVCDIDPSVLEAVRRGTVIPAQVLALNADRSFAPKYQRALCRYFIDAGVGGIAVGVHSTQFAIRDPKIGLFKPVLQETGKFIDEWCQRTGKKILKVGEDINANGYPYVVQTDPESCIGCAICCSMCPEGAIELYK